MSSVSVRYGLKVALSTREYPCVRGVRVRPGRGLVDGDETRRFGGATPRRSTSWSVGVSGDGLRDCEAQDDEDRREQDDREHRDRERSPRVLVQVGMRHVRVRYMRMLQMTSRHPAPPPSLGRIRDAVRGAGLSLAPAVRLVAESRNCSTPLGYQKNA